MKHTLEADRPRIVFSEMKSFVADGGHDVSCSLGDRALSPRIRIRLKDPAQM
jgi:hypothetical protein